MKAFPPIPRVPERLDVARRCLRMIATSLGILEAVGDQSTEAFRVSLRTLQQWLDGNIRDGVLRDGLREMQATRDILQRGIHGHDAGLSRIDATVRTTMAYMLWRVGAFITGQQDETVEVWCRMGLAEVHARHASPESRGISWPTEALPVAPTSAGMELRMYPAPMSPLGAYAVYQHDPHARLRMLLDHLADESRAEVIRAGAEVLVMHWPVSADAIASGLERVMAASPTNLPLLRVLLACGRWVARGPGLEPEADAAFVAALRRGAGLADEEACLAACASIADFDPAGREFLSGVAERDGRPAVRAAVAGLLAEAAPA